MPGWSRSSPTSSVRRYLRTSGRPACRRWSVPWTSRRSARPPGMRPSSRCAATSRSATTSKRARSRSPGICSRSLFQRAATDSRRRSSGSRCMRTTTRRPGSGRNWSVCPLNGSSAGAWWTTSGPWVCRDRVGRAARSITTAARNTAVRAVRWQMKTAISRCGTSCSCSSNAVRDPARRASRSLANCPPRTSTPDSDSSAWRPFCRGSTTSTRSTPRARRSTPLWRSRGARTVAITPTTWPFALWPTTRAPAPSSSPMGYCRATRAAGMSCGACCDAWFSICDCSVLTNRPCLR